MTPRDIALHKRANTLLLDALARPEDEREAFLDQACNAEERPLVDALLGLGADALAAADRPLLRLVPTIDDDAMTGRRVGPYRIVHELGRGGTGAVYLAERVDGVFERRVAIKVLKRGMDTDDLVARFQAERRILAQLTHPNIAPLLEGGALDDGRPYFVLPHVEGDLIDRHCDHHRLTLRARITLLRKVCDAVAHAHRNLVVHRDLKPSNILVDRDGAPKLLDFGIAKLLDPDTHRPITGTAPGMRPLTPAYASPEQLAGAPITTATDIHALGVVLFELLTGARPAPCTPDDAGDGTAATRASDAAADPRRARALRGDLDTILGTAMHRDPARRYPSVEAFDDDLRRYLDGHPVRARADTWRYRLGKLLRRRRRSFAVATLVVLALGTLAVDRELEQRRATRERARAVEVSDFMLQLFQLGDGADGSRVLARDLLDRGATRIADELVGQPDLQAALMEVIGNGYVSLGLYDDAAPMLEGALALRRQHFGPRHDEVITSLLTLAGLDTSRGRFEAAETALQEAAALQRTLHGEEDERYFRALNQLGLVRLGKGAFAEAERLHRRSAEGYRRLLGPSSRPVAAVEGNLAIALYRLGRYREATTELRRALATSSSLLGHEHAQTASARANLAVVLGALGTYREAEPISREILALSERRHGGEHPAVANNLNNLAVLLTKRGQTEEAEHLLTRAEAIWRARLGDDHLSVATARANRARALAGLGRTNEARAAAESAHALAARLVGDTHPRTLSIGAVLAERHLEAGDLEAATSLALQVHAARTSALGADHPDTAGISRLLGDVHLAAGDPIAAESYARQAHEILSAKLEASHPRTARAAGTLGAALGALGRYDDAEPLLRHAVTVARRSNGADGPLTARAEARLAALLIEQGAGS